MMLLRSLRLPRLPTGMAAACALLGFVFLVGPDPSVLRAALMGAIGLAALLGGRPKQSATLLAVSIVALLMADPWLAADYAFILSVLATLGLCLIGQRCVVWLRSFLPLWLAQAVAIPVAAQLFCAPVIVLLQPRLTPYTIVANVLAAPVVAWVTTLGTLGLVLAMVAPLPAQFCAALAGAGAWWVAAVAHVFAALPGASLPWPGGGAGVALMAVANALLLAGLVALAEPDTARAAVAKLLRRLPDRLRGRVFPGIVFLAACATALWTAMVIT